MAFEVRVLGFGEQQQQPLHREMQTLHHLLESVFLRILGELNRKKTSV